MKLKTEARNKTHKYSQMFFDKRVKTHGIKKKKKRIDFSRNGAGISEDPCIHYPNYFHRKTLFFIAYKK